jgi:hypothetical protein
MGEEDKARRAAMSAAGQAIARVFLSLRSELRIMTAAA